MRIQIDSEHTLEVSPEDEELQFLPMIVSDGIPKFFAISKEGKVYLRRVSLLILQRVRKTWPRDPSIGPKNANQFDLRRENLL